MSDSKDDDAIFAEIMCVIGVNPIASLIAAYTEVLVGIDIEIECSCECDFGFVNFGDTCSDCKVNTMVCSECNNDYDDDDGFFVIDMKSFCTSCANKHHIDYRQFDEMVFKITGEICDMKGVTLNECDWSHIFGERTCVNNEDFDYCPYAEWCKTCVQRTHRCVCTFVSCETCECTGCD